MKLYISRHGLVQCPSCRVHFRADGDPYSAAWIAAASCPTCGVAIGQSGGGGTLDRLRSAGRSGVMAAALFGLAAAGPLAGCEKTPTEKTETEPEPAPDSPAEPEYGAPAMMEPKPEPAPDAPGEPEYGAPAVILDAAEPPIEALYGVVPDPMDSVPLDPIAPAEPTEPPADDAKPVTPTPADDNVPVPEYGKPAMPDEEKTEDQVAPTPTPAPDPPMKALYGKPPIPRDG